MLWRNEYTIGLALTGCKARVRRRSSTVITATRTGREQDWPLTGPTSLPFNMAVDQSVTDLNTAITQAYPGDDIVVLGYPQSTVAATLEMNALDTLPADQRPSPADLHFALLGDMNNPDGGVYERFSFLNPFMNLSPISALNQPYFVATPPDTPYPTDIYTIQYDGVADFPQYPIDIPADLNAGMGLIDSHLGYATLTPDQLAEAQLLPGSAALTGVGVTNYYLIPVEHLPLLQPLYQSGVGVLSPVLDVVVDARLARRLTSESGSQLSIRLSRSRSTGSVPARESWCLVT
jgi:hypothetical protein